MYREQLPDVNQDWISRGSDWLNLFAAAGFKNKTQSQLFAV